MYNYGNYATPNYSDDRFFGVPFLVGGIAGTALGYGLASNQNNQGETFYPVYPTVPMYPTSQCIQHIIKQPQYIHHIQHIPQVIIITIKSLRTFFHLTR